MDAWEFVTYLAYIVLFILAIVFYKLIDHAWLMPRIGKNNERYILITGCDTGFGQAIARRLDRLGCHVFAGCLTEVGQKDLIRSCSGKLKVFSLDVSNHDSVLQAFEFVKSKLPSGNGLWGVLNNAGILGRCGPNEWLNLDDYKQVAAVNLYGLIDVTITFLPLVKKARGRIVNTASVFGRHSLSGCTPYSVSKYGVEAFTDSMRRALRLYGCKAILIEPGCHKTPITSKQNIEQVFQEAWDHASPEIRAEFGEQYFQYHISKIHNRFDKLSSGHIEDVIDAYEHALLGRFTRARYVIGVDAKVLWLPVQWLPEWLGDYILWRLSRMDSESPLPAAIKKNK